MHSMGRIRSGLRNGIVSLALVLSFLTILIIRESGDRCSGLNRGEYNAQLAKVILAELEKRAKKTRNNINEPEVVETAPEVRHNVRQLLFLTEILQTYQETVSKSRDLNRTTVDNLQRTISEMSNKTDDVNSFRILKELVEKINATRAIPVPPNQIAYLNIHEVTDQNSSDIFQSFHPSWKRFQNGISPYGLYSAADDDQLVEELLHDLRTLPFTDISDIPKAGTQVKFVYWLKDGSKSLFKPMRVPRDLDESMDIYYMYETERHTAEIAAFHLNRLLGFRNVPPVAGRKIHMIKELGNFLREDLQERFYRSPVDNVCFFADCDYFCDAAHGVCGVGEQLEGSFAAFIPDYNIVDIVDQEHPWTRSYSRINKTRWETTLEGAGYCAEVRGKSPFNRDGPMLDVIDCAIFDFITGNKDRHHLFTFAPFGNESSLVLFDNGKGFGRSRNDIIDILAPLYQCCMVRFTTLRILLEFHTSDRKLSDRMRISLAKDALPDILTEAHLEALDRRVRIILEQIHICVRSKPIREVIIDDGYYFDRG